MSNKKQGTIIGLGLGIVQIAIVSLIISKYVTMSEWYVFIPLVALIVIPAYLGSVLDEWKERAEVDSLTNVLNRRCLTSSFSKFAKTSLKQKKKCALFVLDVNDFKGINDTKGHMFGDRVLAEIASSLKTCLRSNDLIVRWGGDEFIVLTQINNNGNLDDVKARIKKEMIAVSKRVKVQVDVSIGHSVFPDQGKKLGKLIQAADANMYENKQYRLKIVENSRQEA
ncbi:MAG: hypothetical protein K0S51_1482 [Bacillales bacterium]|jgi:diguanylate cyclase (GGDEF)-like protein|nr:hypothetical protein [Bacillales bacterium]